MADNLILLEVSAFSGLAGALFTQVISAVNTYFIDRRKQTAEVRSQHRAKKIEIGESFYYITGEKMACINKNIRYWKNWNNSRSEASLDFLNKETSQFNSYMEQLNADNWKYNLISLYFNVSFTNDEVVKSNARSHQLYLLYLDLAEKIRMSEDDIKTEELHQRFAVTVYEMCSHYEEIYARLKHDSETVKTQLLNEFAV